MKRFRAELSLLALVAGCAHPFRLPGVPVDSHPAEFVGTWVDVVKSSPRDTSFWVLDAHGHDDLVRVVRDSAGVPHTSRRHFGYWYAAPDGAGGAFSFCVSHGRTAGACTPATFSRDTVAGVALRRMQLSEYKGNHSLGRRLLQEVPAGAG